MSHFPCKNPNCASYGRPHPNCHCTGMAEGGEVKNFCEETKPHKKECQYFAEGGVASPSLEKGIEPKWEDTKPLSEPNNNQAPKWEDTLPLKDFETPLQQIGAGLEGAARGFAGPLATAAELGLSKLGVPHLGAEDIAGRQEANPGIATVGEIAGTGAGLMTGVGEAALATKAAARFLPEAIPLLGKAGAKVIQGFVSNAAIGTGNELTKAMLGQGNSEAPVATALANIGINGLIGGIFEGGSKALASTNLKLGSKAASILAGMGAKSENLPGDLAVRQFNMVQKGLFDEKAFKLGYDNYQKFVEEAVGKASDIGGIMTGGPLGYIFSDKIIKPLLKGVLKEPIEKGAGLTVPTVTKWLSEGAPSHLLPLLDYATKIDQGNRLVNSAIKSLFITGNEKITKSLDKERKRADEWIENGGVDNEIQQSIYDMNSPSPQGFAEGGEVEKGQEEQTVFNDNPISQVYPEQNILLQSAKGRIYNYLKGLRPAGAPLPSLTYDYETDNREQQKNYDRALDIAIKPLSIMNEIKEGTIEPDHIKHFNALYPELSSVVQKRLTDEIVQTRLKGEKPDYKVRQGLSMFLGTPLSPELVPQNIQAIQATFMPKQPDASPQGGSSSSKKSLSKSDQAYLTSSQALASRQQRQ